MIGIKLYILLQADIEAEVGEVILGKNGGRKTATEVTLFKSLGNNFCEKSEYI